MWLSLILFPLVIFFFIMSAFFSSAETAVFSIDEVKIKKIRSYKTKKIVKNFMKNSSLFLLTILLGNTIANILISSSLERILPIKQPLLLTIVITSLILLFGEIIPKFFALNFSIGLVSIYSNILYGIFKILKPVLKYIDSLLVKLTEKIRRKKEAPQKEESYLALQSIVSRGGIFDMEEKELIENVLNFVRRNVWNIMTPRNRVFSVERKSTLKEVLEELGERKYSKIPVYENTDDYIIGYLELKDLLLYQLKNKEKDVSIDKFLKPMYFVPETKTLPEMLEDFQKKGIKIATVVDNYGSAVGIVTIADVLGEILGEFIDESFGIEDKIIQLSENRYLVSGDISIDDFNDYFNTSIESKEYETIAGFIISSVGDIPKEGDYIKVEDKKITVKRKKQTHIEQLIVEKI